MADSAKAIPASPAAASRPLARPAVASRWTMAAVIAIALLALAIRLWGAQRSPWVDEWASIFFADQPLERLWSTWMVRETNPPLYYTLLKAWRALFGHDDLAARLLSVLAGLGSIAVLAHCARIVAGTRAALIAALLCALSAPHVFHGTSMRGYIFALLAFSVSLLGVMRLAEPGGSARRRWRPALLYAGGAVAAIHFHTTMLVWPVAASLVLALRAGRDRREWGYLAAVNLAIVAACGWWLAITWWQLSSGRQTVAWIEPVGTLGLVSMLRQSILLVEGNQGLVKLGSYGVAALALLPLALRRNAPSIERGRGERDPALLVAQLLLASIAVFWLANLAAPIAMRRTLFWMSGLTVILVCAGLARISPAWLRWLLVAGVAFLLSADLARARGDFLSEDWPAALRAVPPGATVIVANREIGVVAQQTCQTLAEPCPVHLAGAQVLPAGSSWGDAFRGQSWPVQHGAGLPLAGPTYVLDSLSGVASSQFDMPGGVAVRRIGGLELRGPLDAARLRQK